MDWRVAVQKTRALQREAANNRHAPTFIPLPVFKFTEPPSPGRSGSLGNIHFIQSDINATRRNTLTTLFLDTPPAVKRRQLTKTFTSPTGVITVFFLFLADICLQQSLFHIIDNIICYGEWYFTRLRLPLILV